MTYRRRTFPEVLERLLVATVGGIAAEEHPFPPPGDSPWPQALLHTPVQQVVSLYGTLNGQGHLFVQDRDYSLSVDRKSITWLDGGDTPDRGSVISINYLQQGAAGTLNDLHVGSITRTLAESVGLEIARVYAQLQFVYEAGFIDTASGRSLDNIVSLLGIRRIKGGYPAGTLELVRSASGSGSITIPAGTRVLDETGNVEYETTSTVTMAPHQDRIRVGIRDLEPNDPMPAGTLTVLAIPIAGIASVTNPAPTAISVEEENDSQLRDRAKDFLHGSERATLGAIRQAIARQQISADVAEAAEPGRVEYTLHAESIPPELEQRVKTAIEQVRPAGVLVISRGHVPPKKVNMSIELHTTSGALEADLRNTHQQVKKAIEEYLKALPLADDGSLNQMVGRIMAVPLVEDVKIISAVLEDAPGVQVLDTAAGKIALSGFPTQLGSLDMIDPGLPTRVSIVVSFPASSEIPDETVMKQALKTTITYLNSENSRPDADTTIRQLSLGKLLLVLPLPGHTPGSLQDYDKAPVPAVLPSAADIAPYSVVFTFSQEGGLTRFVQNDGESYELSPGEQLAFSTLALMPEDENG